MLFIKIVFALESISGKTFLCLPVVALTCLTILNTFIHHKDRVSVYSPQVTRANVEHEILKLQLHTQHSGLKTETSSLVCRYDFRISRSSSYIRVIGLRSRSQEQKVCLHACSVWALSFEYLGLQTSFLVCSYIFGTSRSEVKYQGHGVRVKVMRALLSRYICKWPAFDLFLHKPVKL